jgi:anthranilate synthase component I
VAAQTTFVEEKRALDIGGVDGLSALAALQELRGAHAFLIEKDGTKAFVGAGPFSILSIGRGRLLEETERGRKVLPGNPYEALGRRLARFRVLGSSTPFAGGAVGGLSYDMARHLERLDLPREEEEGRLMLFDRVLALEGGRATLVGLLDVKRRRAQSRELGELAGTLERALRERHGQAFRFGAPPKSLPEMAGSTGKDGFFEGVRRVKRHIRAGDIFQCVLSERFQVPTSAEPERLYAAVAAVSPSPYRFLMKDGETALIGASPERLVKVQDGVALNCPIAGTRPRGENAKADKAFEKALLKSPKERAEHLMLVDLGRNDLGRVCAPGTVKVRNLMEVRRFSNVMHLVSEVEGRLDKGRSAWDALMASFPAGTVSGAPKVRAMEIIAALEKRARGFYAGAVLQHDFSGRLDSCIAIRTMRLRQGVATLQAGAGIVADSMPAREYQEILNKLSGLRRALALCDGRH